MSIKSSLALRQWEKQYEIHIYKEMLDDKYYIETEEGKLSIPEDIAKMFAKALERYGD